MMSLMDLVGQRVAVVRSAVMPNLVPIGPRLAEVNVASGDIIKHPQNFPLAVRQIWPWYRLRRWLMSESSVDGVGLQFFSGRFYAPRTTIELSISLRHQVHRFEAVVVAVRDANAGYEVSAWLTSAADSTRLRLVEQICALECKIRPKPRTSAVRPEPSNTRRRSRAHALRLA
jgi:hypothetical protein